MFHYEKKLQFPVKIATPNPKLAAFIISQYGGPDGELGASMRYLSQRYAMPYAEAKGLLTDIGTEELGHMEMVAAIVHQLTRNLSDEEVRANPSHHDGMRRSSLIRPSPPTSWTTPPASTPPPPLASPGAPAPSSPPATSSLT